jgi:catechol 2,3-dioxygenase-like lactoylglutathione lyase family enzyme
MPERSPAESTVTFARPQVNLYSADLERALRFYGDVLGFPETFRVPKEGAPAHVELAVGPLRLGIATFDALRHEHGIDTGPGPPRGGLVLFTDDVDGAYGWATRHGAPSLSPPHDFGGYVHSARVGDPDGNPVGFTTRLPVRATANVEVRPTFRNHLFDFYCEAIAPALSFYRDRLGFSETFRTPREGSPDHVELELEPLNLSVSTLAALRRDHGLTGGGGPPRAEVVVWVPDADRAYAQLKSEGVRGLSAPHAFAGVLRAAWVADPEGNPVQLVARTGPT